MHTARHVTTDPGQAKFPERPALIPEAADLERIGGDFISANLIENAPIKLGCGADPLPDGTRFWEPCSYIALLGWAGAGGAGLIGAAKKIDSGATEPWEPIIANDETFKYRGRSVAYICAVMGFALENFFVPNTVAYIRPESDRYLQWVGFLHFLSSRDT